MSKTFSELQDTIATLRAPGGCPWDRKQDLVSASRYLLDEAAELVEAALARDNEGAVEELGDLLFMVSFCTRILGETTGVDMHQVARLGNEKLIRRHPLVFGGSGTKDVEESQEAWNAIKAEEKRAKGIDPELESALKDLPASTAPLHQAYGYQKNAAEQGFDWPDLEGVWAKLREELAELEEAAAGGQTDQIEHEVGDVLFSVVNLSRRLNVQPDMALRRANNRFRDRFHLVEEDFRTRGESLAEASLDEMEGSWQKAKARLAK